MAVHLWATVLTCQEGAGPTPAAGLGLGAPLSQRQAWKRSRVSRPRPGAMLPVQASFLTKQPLSTAPKTHPPPPPTPRKWLSLSRCQQHQGGVRGARKTGAWSSGAAKHGSRPRRAEHPSGGCPPPQKGGATEAAWPPVWGAVPRTAVRSPGATYQGRASPRGAQEGAHSPRQLDEEETRCSFSACAALWLARFYIVFRVQPHFHPKTW